jgi:hypothetical protein
LVECDPITHASQPHRHDTTYTTPIALQDPSSTSDVTWWWSEGTQACVDPVKDDPLDPATMPNTVCGQYYHSFVTFFDGTAGRECAITDEWDYEQAPDWVPAFDPITEDAAPRAIRGSPTLLGSGTRRVAYGNTISGWFAGYAVSGSIYPEICTSSTCGVEDLVLLGPNEHAGADSSAFVGANDGIALVDWVDLGTYCFEDDDPASEVAWRPISVISGVTIRGSRVYVATNDGRFWEYDTAPGSGQADIGKWFVNGYADGWPRFRSDNRGSAR